MKHCVCVFLQSDSAARGRVQRRWRVRIEERTVVLSCCFDKERGRQMSSGYMQVYVFYNEVWTLSYGRRPIWDPEGLKTVKR